MTVYFIGAGPGDPELLTIRGRKLIEHCPVCLYAGSLVPEAIVAGAPAGAKIIDTASLHLDQIIAHMKEAHAAGQDVARVHSGDPSIYGAIAEQMRRLDDLDIPYEVVPGVSSFTAAAAALKLELTPAGANQTVILTRAPGRTGLPDNESLAELARHGTGMVLFLSAAQVPDVVESLAPHYGLDAPVVVAYRVSWPDEKIIRCTLATLAEEMKKAKITLTALICVGPMLESSNASQSHLYDASYTHRFRRASTSEAVQATAPALKTTDPAIGVESKYLRLSPATTAFRTWLYLAGRVGFMLGVTVLLLLFALILLAIANTLLKLGP
jgi:precorrin-4/cobalt-precorrin-4 C11-methyltransferase